MITQEAHEELHPSRLDVGFFRFSGSDWKLTIAVIAIGFIVGNFYGSLPQAGLALVWFGLMVRRNRARMYRIFVRGLRGWFRVRVRKGIVFDEEKVIRVKKKDAKGNETVIPFWVTSVPAGRNTPETAVLYNLQDNSLSVVIEGGGSTIPSQSLVGQDRAYSNFETMVKRAALKQRGYSLGVGYVFRQDPFDETHLHNALGYLLHPDLVHPEARFKNEDELTDEDRAILNMAEPWEEMRQIMPEYGRKPWMATVLTIKREGSFAKAQESGLISERHLRRLPVAKIVTTAQQHLRACGVSNPQPLNESGLHAFVRGAWDIAKIQEYYAKADVDGGNDVVSHWPDEKMVVSDKDSLTDGTVTKVYRITGAPERVWQGFFREEFMANLPVSYPSVALVGEAVRSDREVHWIEVGSNFIQGFVDWLGLVETRKSTARSERLNQRGDTLFASQFSQSYSILVAVRTADRLLLDEDGKTRTVTAHDVCEDELEALEAFVEGLGLSGELIEGGDYQYPSLWSSTTALALL